MSKFLRYAKAASSLEVHNWTLEDYHALIEKGVLNSKHKVELLFGQIVNKHPASTAHAQTVDKIVESFIVQFVGQDRVVRGQNPVTLPNDSEPEPDICVAQGPRSQYNDHHPYPEDILLLIEVSDSTLKMDRGVKLISYASAGIREYWIIDVYGRKVERHTQPDVNAGSYGSSEVFAEGETITSLQLGAFSVGDLLVQYK